MITIEPKNWKDLQQKVNFILNGVGLDSETEVAVETPRGSVEIDVLAIDNNSLDKIRYIVECKNWNKRIPQTVIHSFLTVMNETGGHIGYVISKKGFQKGAFEHSKFTNIKLLTYDEFQKQYFEIWYERYFLKEISKINKDLIHYVGINHGGTSNIFYDGLSESLKLKFDLLAKQYCKFSNFIFIISNDMFKYDENDKIKIRSISDFKDLVFSQLNIVLSSINYTDLISELKEITDIGIDKFENFIKSHGVKRFYKRPLELTNKDVVDDFGLSANMYYELDIFMFPTRQILASENGIRLKYHAGHIEDEYGELDQRCFDNMMNLIEISMSDFEEEWKYERKVS